MNTELLMYVVGLCTGIFIGTVVISIASLMDYRRAVKEIKRELFEEFKEVICELFEEFGEVIFKNTERPVVDEIRLLKED